MNQLLSVAEEFVNIVKGIKHTPSKVAPNWKVTAFLSVWVVV
jgi:hypothetical protein